MDAQNEELNWSRAQMDFARLAGMAQMMGAVIAWLEVNRSLLSEEALGGLLTAMAGLLDTEMDKAEGSTERTLQ